MPKPIKIKLEIDGREVEREFDRIEDATEQFTRALDDAADEGDDLERSLSDNLRDIGRDAERAGKDVKDGLGDGFAQADSANLRSAAGSAAGEVVDEFVENLGEGIRSGDFLGVFRETISQLGQVGGAIGGPAGAVVGGALAIGLTAAFDKIVDLEMREAIKRIMDQAAADAIDYGTETGLGFAQSFYGALDSEERRRGDLTEFFGAETFNDAIDEATALADKLGVEFETVGDVITGNVTEQQRAVNELEEQRSVLADQLKQELELNALDGVGNRLNQDKIDKLNGQIRAYDDLLGDANQLQTATRKTGDNLSTWEGYVRTTASAAARARDAINATRPPDMSQSAYNLERMQAAAVSTKYTLDQIRDKTVTVNVRTAGATGQGGITA